MTEAEQKIDGKLNSILEKLSNLQSVQEATESRLDEIEITVASVIESNGDSEIDRRVGENTAPNTASDLTGVNLPRGRASFRTRAIRNLVQTQNDHNYAQGVVGSGAGAVSQQCDIQEQYRAIKDALQRVKLPPEVKVDDSKQGIKRQELSKAHIISKSAQYCETLYKLLLTLEPEQTLSQGDLEDLNTIVLANIRYLQEERGLVLVNSSLGSGVGGIYRNFRRNTTVFPPDALDALTAAVTLHSASSNNSAQPQQFNQRQRGGYRGSYRGSRGGYQNYNQSFGRGHHFNNRIQGNSGNTNDASDYHS